MKRFISSESLARDRRFKRTRSRNELLRSLPDDVDTIVDVMERIAQSNVRSVVLEHIVDSEREKGYDEVIERNREKYGVKESNDGVVEVITEVEDQLIILLGHGEDHPEDVVLHIEILARLPASVGADLSSLVIKSRLSTTLKPSLSTSC